MTLGYDYAFKRIRCRECRSDVTGIFLAKGALDACQDYFEGRADADGDSEGLHGNEEMRLLVEVETALQALAGAGDCPLCRYAALAAGTRSAETNEDLAQSEGCQSGPQGNAQPSPSRNPK